MIRDFDNLMNGQIFRKLCEIKYESLMEEYQLRKIELDILYFLSKDGQHDTAKDIVSLRHISKAHISGAIDQLVHRQYVTLIADPRDRRCNHIVLTEAAVPIVKKITSIKQEISRIMYQGITEEETEVMQRVVQKITDNIEQELTKQM